MIGCIRKSNEARIFDPSKEDFHNQINQILTRHPRIYTRVYINKPNDEKSSGVINHRNMMREQKLRPSDVIR